MDAAAPFSSRIMYRDSRPNPLFEEWISELLAEAVEKKSRLEPMLRQALDSIKRYPLRLQTGADCAILIGFHKKLCEFLDYRFSVYESIIAEELEEERALAQNITDIDERGNKIYEKSVSSSNTQSDDASLYGHNNQDDDVQVVANTSPENRNAIAGPSRSALTISEQNSARAATIAEQITRTLSLRTQNNASTSSNEVSSLQCEDQIPGPSAAPFEPEPGPSTSKEVSLNITNIKKGGKYKPAYRTTSYAILLALLEYTKINPSGALNKPQLAKLGQKYCDESLFMPESRKCNTAIISAGVTRLVKKGLVARIRQTRLEYHLTDKGKKLAELLLRETKQSGGNSVTDEITGAHAQSNTDVTESEIAESSIAGETIEFPAGSYDIILLIDKNETSGVSNRDDPTVALFNSYPQLKHEYRSLKVGDFTWIAQHKVTKQELVLPYIIERKRMDDLAASIKDGRFHEQKFRLHKCGLSTVIYMVEAYGNNKNLGLPLQSLKQALVNTQIHDGYKILAANSLAHTVRLLALLTVKMIKEYRDKPLKGRNGAVPCGVELQTYQFFSKISSKNKALNVNGLFLKQLLQLKGLSVEKALAISKQYPTPHLLVQEYKRLSQSQGEMLLANLKYGDTSRNVGPNVSKTVYELFTQRVEE